MLHPNNTTSVISCISRDVVKVRFKQLIPDPDPDLDSDSDSDPDPDPDPDSDSHPDPDPDADPGVCCSGRTHQHSHKKSLKYQRLNLTGLVPHE